MGRHGQLRYETSGMQMGDVEGNDDSLVIRIWRDLCPGMFMAVWVTMRDCATMICTV
jgi:hypothetical protein